MSVSKQAIKRGSILDEIMAYHRQQLPKIKRKVPLSDLRALISVAPETVSLSGAIKEPGITLIAECKKASPSKGLLVRDYDVVRLAGHYLEAGAGAISVLTDARHFQGSLEDLQQVKAVASGQKVGEEQELSVSENRKIPVLRKDFIFDPYQLYESRAAGADAVLLIAAVLTAGELKQLLQLASELRLEALVEVHSESELNQALSVNSTVIGINNRDLKTFKVDLNTTVALRKMIPAGVTIVAESGIKTGDDVRMMAAIGVDAVLVGQSLVQSKDPCQAAKDLVKAGMTS